MDAGPLTSDVAGGGAAEGGAVGRRVPSPIGVLGAAVAGQLAFVVAPAAVHGVGGGVLFFVAGCLAPLALVWGLVRVSAPMLLCLVPLGWALPGYGLAGEAFDGASGPVAWVVGLAYAVVTLVWLRGAQRVAVGRSVVEWAAIDGVAARGERDVLPWVGGVLVAAPAVGVAFWPPIARALAVGFPGRTGLVGAMLGLLGTLVALALVTDLARGRRRRRGDRERVVLLAGVTGLLLALWAVLR